MTRTWKMAWILPALLVAGLVILAGCESDPVAPQDKLPAVTAEDAVTQAAWFAFYLNAAYDVFVDNTKSGKAETIVVDEGNVQGAFTADFRCGGASGDPCASADADFVRINTGAGQSIRLYESLGDPEPLIVATFDIDVTGYDGTPGAESGTLTGDGRLVAGDYTTRFTIDGVYLSASAWPAAGTLDYDVVGPNDPTVTFNGTVNAGIEVSGESYTVNLDTGALTGPLKGE